MRKSQLQQVAQGATGLRAQRRRALVLLPEPGRSQSDVQRQRGGAPGCVALPSHPGPCAAGSAQAGPSTRCPFDLLAAARCCLHAVRLPAVCAPRLQCRAASLACLRAPQPPATTLLPPPLQEYKEAIEISAPADAEEAEHNRLIRERLTAGLLASTSGGGRGGKGRGRG